jgi:hypothetical protein
MATLILTIKGNVSQAKAAALMRGIHTHREEEVSPGQTICAVPRTAGNLYRVAEWFCEPGLAVQGQGFPAGTLLLYR